MKKKEAEILNYNSVQQKIAQDGKNKRDRLNTEWTHKLSWYRTEYAKVKYLLTQFYSLNILEIPYRNVESTIYLYNYMSSGQASFEEAKLTERMEAGVKKILAKLDEISSQLANYIYETRCANSANQAYLQQTIRQNSQMLDQLQRVSSSSQEAAFYSQLSSNYSKANAYFSLANYLKRQ